jgi:general secretion pathway protein G
MTQESKGKKKLTLPGTIIVVTSAALVVTAAAYILSHKPETPEDRVRYGLAKEDLKVLEDAVRQYLADTGRLPKSLNDLVSSYLPKIPKDPWGRPYGYDRWTDRAFIRFYGRDGHAKGYGVDLDVIAIVWLH